MRFFNYHDIFGAKKKEEKPKISIEQPSIRTSEEENVWREVTKFAKLIPSELEPNMGRVEEIKEEIKKGTYLKQEMIDETAARLAIRFMQKE